MQVTNNLIQKLKSKQAVIGVIGLGYVGLPLVLRFSSVGFKVIGIDVDARKVNQLNDATSYIEHIAGDEIKQALANDFTPTTDFSKTAECDAVIICVPTPLNKYREPDLKYVVGTMESIQPYLREGQVVSLESTSYPGTIEEEIVPRCSTPNLTVGQNIYVVYSPEREDPGNANFSTETITKICGGHTDACLQVGIALYEQAVTNVVPVSSTKTAGKHSSDPHAAVFPIMRKHQFDMSSVDLTAESLLKYDAVLLTTDHDKFDYELIQQNVRLLVDTRGRYLEKRANVVKA